MAYSKLTNLPVELKLDDLIRFKIRSDEFIGVVCSSFINSSQSLNDTIFTKLNLPKYKLASYAYGYPSKTGDWPSCKEYDFKALTRLVQLLFLLSEFPHSIDCEDKISVVVHNSVLIFKL